MFENKPSWWQMMKVKIMMGRPFAPVINMGRVDETVIRYKDKFISVMEDPVTGDIKSLSWMRTPELTHININDFWSSAKPARGAVTQPDGERIRAKRVGKAPFLKSPPNQRRSE